MDGRNLVGYRVVKVVKVAKVAKVVRARGLNSKFQILNSKLL